MDRASIGRIGALIKAKRRERDLGLRAAAAECGVSPSTLSRLERGLSSSLPDADTLTRLAVWLKMPVAALLGGPSPAGAADGPSLTTPEVVEAHLRADKRLAPETAHALARAFRLLYDQLARGEGQEDSTR